MKKFMYILILILMSVPTSTLALTYKPIYTGDSICCEFMIKDQNGIKLTPLTGSIVTLTLQRNPDASKYMIRLVGVYTSTNAKYNYTFEGTSEETANLGIGDAYWYLEITNTPLKLNITVDVSKITIKKGSVKTP